MDKNPCDRRFRSKKDIVKYIVNSNKMDNVKQSMNKSDMFLILAEMAKSTEQYYDNSDVKLNAFANLLHTFFNKDELCLELDKHFYNLEQEQPRQQPRQEQPRQEQQYHQPRHQPRQQYMEEVWDPKFR